MNSPDLNQVIQTSEADLNGIPVDEYGNIDLKQMNVLNARDLPPQIEPVPYIVKGVLNQNSMAYVYAQPSTGKTFFTLDLAYHAAAGRVWMGKRVNRTNVLYCIQEGVTGFKNRMKAIQQEKNFADTDFYYRTERINLMKDADTDDIIRQARAVRNGLPVLVIIDTLSQALAGEDENSSKPMSKVVGECQRIQREAEAAVLLVHHTGKAKDNKTVRGHSALRGGTDTEILLERTSESEENLIVKATTKKQRDGQEGALCTFQLEKVYMGNDAEGDQITSRIIRQVEDSFDGAGFAEVGKDEGPDFKGDHKRAIFECFQLLRKELGQDMVPVERLKEAYIIKKKPTNGRQMWAQNFRQMQDFHYLTVVGAEDVKEGDWRKFASLRLRG